MLAGPPGEGSFRERFPIRRHDPYAGEFRAVIDIAEHAGTIIGKRGAKIKELTAACGTKIEVQRGGKGGKDGKGRGVQNGLPDP